MGHTPVTLLKGSLEAWPGDGFTAALKAEMESLPPAALPLQQGLSQGSHLGPSPFQVMLIEASEREDCILAKVGVMFTGIIAGCSCADDPTPVDEINEYCEIMVSIDKASAGARFELRN